MWFQLNGCKVGEAIALDLDDHRIACIDHMQPVFAMVVDLVVFDIHVDAVNLYRILLDVVDAVGEMEEREREELIIQCYRVLSIKGFVAIEWERNWLTSNRVVSIKGFVFIERQETIVCCRIYR